MIWLALILLLGCSSQDGSAPPVQAKPHTLATWDRNAESEHVTHYRVYLCDAPGCTIAQEESFVVAMVGQPPEGERPEWHLPPAVTGALAVSAVNGAGESPLSPSVSFAS